MEQRRRFVESLVTLVDPEVYGPLIQTEETLSQCVNSWNVVIWYHRLDAKIELLWEMKLLDGGIYTRLKGTLEDYYRSMMRRAKEEEL